MKTILTFSLLAICNIIFGQKIINDFEHFLTSMDTFDNGMLASGGFKDSSIFLPNTYDHSFDSWGGWAISNKSDTITPGFSNQYSCIAGQGAKESDSYAVTSAFLPVTIQLNSNHNPTVIDTIYLNNSTYTYQSIRDGDQFAKRFGGVTGDDPDFFKVTIKKYLNGELATDSIDFYLADYRFENNAEDYIVRDWKALDVSALGMVDSLVFSLESSDAGAFGINTPAYFCLDRVITDNPITNTTNNRLSEISTYPNPTSYQVFLHQDSDVNYSYEILNSNGVKVDNGSASRFTSIDVQHLVPGSYFIRLMSEEEWRYIKFIKE